MSFPIQKAAFCVLSVAAACAGSGVAGPLTLLDDPFATGALSARSPGASAQAQRAAGDPCAATAPGGDGWTLMQVIDHALCHNPKTRQSWATARVLAAQVGVNQAAYLPTVNISSTLSRSQSSPAQGRPSSASSVNGGNFQFPQQTRVNPTMSFNYLLFDFGSRAGRLENARQALEAANWSHDANLQTVIFSAVQTYFQFFAAQSAVEATRATALSSAEALKAAKVRHDVGAGTLADVLQANTADAQARLNVVKAEGDASIALGNLANAAGLDPSPGFKVVAPTFAAPDSQGEEAVESLIQEARRQRPDLAAADAQIKAARANVAVAKASGLPTFSLVGSYAYNYSSVFTDTENWSVGLQVNVPLFTGFSNTYQIRAAEEQVAVQQASREQIAQTVALDVWQAYYSLNTARETLGSTAELVNSAVQAEKVSLGRYKAGAGNILDVLSTQASLASARVQKIQAQFTWAIARARLAQAIGHLDLGGLSDSLPETSSSARGSTP